MDRDSFIRYFVSDKMKYENVTSTRVLVQLLSKRIEIFLKRTFKRDSFVPHLLFIFACTITFCRLFARIQPILSICFIDDRIIMIDYWLLSCLYNKFHNKYDGVAATKM